MPSTYCDVTEEYAVLDDALVTSFITITANSAVLDDASLTGQISTLHESAVLNDAVSAVRATIASETAVLNDGKPAYGITVVNWTTETARALDALSTVNTSLTSETAVLNDVVKSVVGELTREAAVLDDALLKGTTVGNASADAAVLDDRATSVVDDVASETAELADGLIGALLVGDVTREDAVLGDALLVGWTCADATREAAVLDDMLLWYAVRGGFCSERLTIHDRLLVARSGAAWAAPTDTFAMSRYADFPFASLADVDGVLLAAGEDGLYRLDPKADLDWSVTGDLTDNLDGRDGLQTVTALKRPLYAYFAYEGGGFDVLLGETATGDEVTHAYALPSGTVRRTSPQRVKLGHGLRSRYYRVSLRGSKAIAMADGHILFTVLQRRF